MTSHDRLRGFAAALMVQALLGWLLIAGLAASWPRASEPALTVVRVAPPPPVEPPPHERQRPAAKHRTPAPARQAAAAEVVAPPIILPPRPSPVVTALQPASGAQPSAGTAGSGAGAGGAGEGSGAGGGLASAPRQIRGEIDDSDYPATAGDQRRGGSVAVRYLVDVDGRVAACEIVRPSGSDDLDETTCRLIRRRFRFAPAHDAAGHPVAAWIPDGIDWIIGARPPAD